MVMSIIDRFRPHDILSYFQLPLSNFRACDLVRVWRFLVNSHAYCAYEMYAYCRQTSFDLAFRQYETRRTGPFQHQPHLIGTCGAVAGPAGSLVRYRLTNAMAHEFATQHDMCAVVALVHPAPRGSSILQKMRVAGSPEFRLDTTDPLHWKWHAVPGSEAVEGTMASGGMHQVAVYSDVTIPPSDPTIEQFNPIVGNVSLFIVDDDL